MRSTSSARTSWACRWEAFWCSGSWNGGAIPFDAEEFRALERRIIAHASRHDISEDPTNPASNSRFLAETLPRSTLVTIDGMGHTIPRAVVPRLATALLSHIEAVERR